MGRREQFTVGRLDITDGVYVNGTAWNAVIADVTSSAAELNVLDGVAVGLTAADLSKLDGSAAVIPSGAAPHAHIVDANAAYVTPGLDTEAELIVAINALGTKVNAILVALETFGITAVA